MESPDYYVLNDRYRCFKTILGSGQSGVVHPGIDQQTGEQLAIKVLDRAHIEGDPARREALRREITVSMRLNHENIIRLKDVVRRRLCESAWPVGLSRSAMFCAGRRAVQVVDPHKIHLVLELASGGELFSQVKRHYLFCM
jgi:serine/threonine protein kinase